MRSVDIVLAGSPSIWFSLQVSTALLYLWFSVSSAFKACVCYLERQCFADSEICLLCVLPSQSGTWVVFYFWFYSQHLFRVKSTYAQLMVTQEFINNLRITFLRNFPYHGLLILSGSLELSFSIPLHSLSFSYVFSCIPTLTVPVSRTKHLKTEREKAMNLTTAWDPNSNCGSRSFSFWILGCFSHLLLPPVLPP